MNIRRLFRSKKSIQSETVAPVVPDFFKRYPPGRVNAGKRRYTRERGIMAGLAVCSHRKPTFNEMLSLGWIHPFKK